MYFVDAINFRRFVCYEHKNKLIGLVILVPFTVAR